MNEVAGFIEQVRRRWLRQRLARTLLVAAISAEVFVAALSFVYLPVSLAFVIGLIGGLLAVTWVTWRGRPTQLETAKAIDDHFGLNELIGTVVSFTAATDSTVAGLLRDQAAAAVSSRSASSMQFGAPRGRDWLGVVLGALIVLNLQPLTGVNLQSHSILPVAAASESALITVSQATSPSEPQQNRFATRGRTSDNENEASASEFDRSQSVTAAHAGDGTADAQTADASLGQPLPTLGQSSIGHAARVATDNSQLIASNASIAANIDDASFTPQSSTDRRPVIQGLPAAYRSIAQRYFSVTGP